MRFTAICYAFSHLVKTRFQGGDPISSSSETPGKNEDPFSGVIWSSARYWRSKHAVGGDVATRYVLVDLLVDHPVYYLGNLILAKYLELNQGLRPWALVSSESDEAIVLMARSFGIEDFTFVRDSVTTSVSPVAVGILEQLEGLEGSALRRRVLGLEIDGLPVGDLLYDTYLREEKRVTIETVDEALRVYVVLLINYYKLYTDILDRHDVAAVVAGAATLERRMAGVGNEFQFLNEEGYSERRSEWSRKEFRDAMNLSPDRKVALIMLHAFPDASHSVPDMIFDDYYDWYLQTLKIASKVKKIDWLIKLHPNLHYYTDDEAPRVTAETFAAEHKHIHLVPESINTRSFPEITDFLVTANGKAGLEFAGAGVPVALIGRAFYAGLGFTTEPESREAYDNLLRNSDELQLSDEQQRRALVANDLFYRSMICDCAYIPDIHYQFWLPFSEIDFWQAYKQALDDITPDDDPLFRAFSDFVGSDDSTLLRPR